MKVKVRIAITSVLILILSVLNIRTGIIFKTTDNTERDAKIYFFSELTNKKENVDIKLETANVPRPAYSYNYSYSSSSSSSNYHKSGKDFADCTNYSDVIGTLTINGRDMTIVNACLVTENGNNYIITPSRPGYVAKYGSLIYAHNTASGLGDLGSATSIEINGTKYHRTDAETVTRAQANSNMASYVRGYPKIYLMTCAGVNYGNGDASHRLVAGFSK